MKKTRKIFKIITVVAIICILAVPFSGFAAKLTRGQDYFYNNAVKGSTFSVDGHTAFCVNPQLRNPPSGTYKETTVNNNNLLKVLYYGYGGPGFNDAAKSKMNSYSGSNISATGNVRYYLLTHRSAAKAYGSSYKFDFYPDWNTAIDGTYAYLTGLNTPSGYEVHVLNYGSSTVQAIAYLVQQAKINLQLTKTSTIPKISTGSKCYSLEGAVYGVYTDKACTKKVGSITTNASGKGSLNNVAAGKTYYTKELIPPKGYALDKTVYTFTDSGTTSNGLKLYKAAVSDTPKNDPVTIMVRKNDRNGKPVANAEFTIVYYANYLTLEQTATTEGLKYWILKTDEKGEAHLNNEYLVKGSSFYTSGTNPNPILPLGTITIQETKAPPGYVLDPQKYIFQITDNSSAETAFVDTFNGYEVIEDETLVNVVKKDNNGKPLPGSTLQIIDKDKKIVKEWVSKDTAEVITGLTEGETYTLHEAKVPAGYKTSDDITFTVKHGDTIEMTDLKTVTKFRKLDSRTNAPVAGAELKIVDSKGNDVGSSWTTSMDTHTVEGLTAGETYQLVEVKAPDNYTKSNPVSFKVSDTTDTTVTMYEAPTETTISKTDITGDKELEGAKMKLEDSDGKLVEEWTSGKEPHKIYGLNKGATYTLTEAIAPLGYTVATPIQFTVNEDGTPTFVKMLDNMTETVISKTDITGDKEIEGAKMKLTDEDGNIIDEWTSGKEPHKIYGLAQGKKYTLTETICPDGFTIATPIDFTINEDGSPTYVAMKDDTTKYSFNKVDDNGKPVLGAVLQLLDENGKVVEEWTTDGKAHEVIGKLVVGKKYTLHEAKTPEGYETAKDITFEVQNISTMQSIDMIDIYKGDVKVSTPDSPSTPDSSFSGNGAAIQTGQVFPISIAAVLISAAIVMILLRRRADKLDR